MRRFAPENHWELDKADMKWWEAERAERVGPESEPKEPPLRVRIFFVGSEMIVLCEQWNDYTETFEAECGDQVLALQLKEFFLDPPCF